MTSLSTAQTREILARYEIDEARVNVSKLLNMSRKTQKRVLRDYYEEPITDPDEIDLRDSVDNLLGAISALQVVGFATGGMPQLPSDIHAEFESFLENRQVLKYYEQLYPTALPILFRHSLNNDAVISRCYQTDESVKSLNILISFFEIDARTRRGSSLPMFLRLLDHYYFDSVNLTRILRIVDDPDLYERLILEEKGEEYEQLGVQGLEEFIEFSCDINTLLDRMELNDNLRGAIWLHHCYWFGYGSKGTGTTTDQLRDAMRKWAERGRRGQSKRISAQMSRVIAILESMTIWRNFAGRLVENVSPLLDGWVAIQSPESDPIARRAITAPRRGSRSRRHGRSLVREESND
jgi:hypothetical protein